MLNRKLVARELRRIADKVNDNSIFQKADEMIQSSPEKFKQLCNKNHFVIHGAFDSISISVILPSELNRNENITIKNSRQNYDSKQEWLDNEESGIVIECNVDKNPKIYLRIETYSIGVVEYIGISSFSSYPFSSDFLSNAKYINKKTLQKEDWNGAYYNPLLNIDENLKRFFMRIFN